MRTMSTTSLDTSRTPSPLEGHHRTSTANQALPWSEATTRVGSLDLAHHSVKKSASPSFEPIAEKLTRAAAAAGATDGAATVTELPKDERPTNFSRTRKILHTSLASAVFFNGAFGSSIASAATKQYITELGMSKTMAASVLSVYMAGYVIAPSIWGPLSEAHGRKLVNLLSLTLFCLFNIGLALAPNKETIMVCRFFAGLFAAAPNSNSGATISDLYDPKERVWPMISYTVAALGGPLFGPLIGNVLSSTGHWRFIFWELSAQSAFIFVLCLVFQRETYVPVLLARRAKQLRKFTGDDSHRAEHDGVSLGWKEVLQTHVSRPLRLLFTELPCAYAAAWMCFAYGLIFLFFEAFPVIYGNIYDFTPIQVGLSFLPLAVGVLASFPLVAYYNKLYLRLHEEAGRPLPEARLSLTKYSAFLFAVGLLWFGWTARTGKIHWIVPMLAEIPIGAGLIFSFNSLGVYVSQVYSPYYVASSLSALTIARSVFAVVCPLFGRQFFEWDVAWASSILAFVAIALAPIPFLFDTFGARIRNNSRFALKD